MRVAGYPDRLPPSAPMRLLLAALLLGLAAPALAQSAGPAGHRLFLAPTARPVPAGQAAVGLTQLAVPTAAAGVGYGVSLGAGVVAVPVPSLAGIVFVEPKWTVWGGPGLAVAVGVAGRANPFQNGAVHAAPYAVATAERGRFAGTVGVGGRLNYERRSSPYDYLRSAGPTVEPCCYEPAAHPARWAVSVVPAAAAFAGLEVRANDRVTWIVEATALPDQNVGYRFAALDAPWLEVERGAVHYDLAVGAGMRVVTGRAAVDAGLLVGSDADGYAAPVFGAAPWLGVTVGLGG